MLEDLTDWVGQDQDKENSERKRKSEDLKNKGNDALRSSDFDEAIHFYKSAVSIDPSNAYQIAIFLYS